MSALTRPPINTKPALPPPPPLGRAAGRLTGRLAKRLGYGRPDLFEHWADIAGEALARDAAPERLAGKGASGGTLTLRVAHGGAAMRVQHVTPQLIERINARLGPRTVGRIKIEQGPVRRPRPLSNDKAPTRQPDAPPPGEAETAALERIADAGLRAALARLRENLARGARSAKDR